MNIEKLLEAYINIKNTIESIDSFYNECAENTLACDNLIDYLDTIIKEIKHMKEEL